MLLIAFLLWLGGCAKSKTPAKFADNASNQALAETTDLRATQLAERAESLAATIAKTEPEQLPAQKPALVSESAGVAADAREVEQYAGELVVRVKSLERSQQSGLRQLQTWAAWLLGIGIAGVVVGAFMWKRTPLILESAGMLVLIAVALFAVVQWLQALIWIAGVGGLVVAAVWAWFTFSPFPNFRPDKPSD